VIWRRIFELGDSRPHWPAMHWNGEVLSYDGLARQMTTLANGFAALGVGRGDRVAWLGANHPGQIGHLLACAWLGAIHVPLNWRLAAPELRAILEDSGTRLVLVTDAQPGMLELARAAAPPGCRVLDPLEPVEGLTLVPPLGGPDDPLLLVYTSGTTGRPKGAVLTQHAVQANADNARAIFGITQHDRILSLLPLFHVGGLNIQTLPGLLNGAEILLWSDFDADRFFESCEISRPSLTLLVPTLMRRLVAHPRWTEADLSALRAIGAGSSEVPLELIEAFHAKGVPVQQVYGATETGPIAIVQSRAEALAAPGSIGHPALLCSARVQDASGMPLPAGATGEIAIRGPNVMEGYWNQPEATDAVLRDGWFATGDVGHVDAAGRFWFTDRLKHVIISGGENIYPAEVERVLRSAPCVAEGAVCGRPDPHWGEVPVAVVVPAEGFSPDAVLAHFAGQLARYKHPRAVVAVEALPRTALGKVQLAALKALARGP
jgi:fatty-acyl-CoA synthase